MRAADGAGALSGTPDDFAAAAAQQGDIHDGGGAASQQQQHQQQQRPEAPYDLKPFPRRRERDPHRLLGVDREASFEEVQDARNYLFEVRPRAWGSGERPIALVQAGALASGVPGDGGLCGMEAGRVRSGVLCGGCLLVNSVWGLRVAPPPRRSASSHTPFTPPPPWQRYKWDEPSREAIEAAFDTLLQKHLKQRRAGGFAPPGFRGGGGGASRGGALGAPSLLERAGELVDPTVTGRTLVNEGAVFGAFAVW